MRLVSVKAVLDIQGSVEVDSEIEVLVELNENSAYAILSPSLPGCSQGRGAAQGDGGTRTHGRSYERENPQAQWLSENPRELHTGPQGST
ncbi:hypothetical protein SCLCIDRAFT_1220954 [Scleroderma citrinum Foug A]|uniref:Uncharacterized protein n=1 Tax=Scleroderma citrinum Foug A TaxID=1036808 RepID=A0A0C2ZT92_9AGAM|nr:hypothetical protein SCLCIDRAFT_1220954 [Scleroderma citrinum Foug A]